MMNYYENYYYTLVHEKIQIESEEKEIRLPKKKHNEKQHEIKSDYNLRKINRSDNRNLEKKIYNLRKPKSS